MKKLDLLILKSFLLPFAMVFFIVIFVLMMNFLWLYIDELVGKGLGMGVIIEFLGWGSATLISTALPLATLIASLMTMGNLGENNELLAMKAAGISLPRILTPLIFVAVIISIGAFFASNNLIPVAFNNIYTLREDIGRTKDEIRIPTGIFYNGIDGYSIRVVRNGDDGKIYEVMVYDHSKNQGNISITLADSGTIKLTSDKSGLLFTLFNGTSYEEDNIRNYQDTTLNLSRINFSRQEIVVPLSNHSFKKSEDAKYGNEVMSRNLSQLRLDKDSLNKIYTETLQSQTKRALTSACNYSFKYLDTNKVDENRTLFNLDSIYTSHNSGIIKWHSNEEELTAINNALTKIQDQIDYSNYYERELFQSAHPKRRTSVEIFRKFTLSFACLLFFFIGAPLGAIIRKGGLGTPIVVSAFFFVFYWIIDMIGKKLANDGSLGPFIGTFISTIVLLPISLFLTKKSTNDSALFNTDMYIDFIKNVVTKKGFIKEEYKKYIENRRLRRM